MVCLVLALLVAVVGFLWRGSTYILILFCAALLLWLAWPPPHRLPGPLALVIVPVILSHYARTAPWLQKTPPPE
jgi:hypothetical protein